MKPTIPSAGIIINNWETMTMTITPSIKEQDEYTHDKRDTFNTRRLATRCQIWYRWR
jgi:hypothetical protein